MAAANASGDFRLPLVSIHKSLKSRCFAGMNVTALPVRYYPRKKGWTNKEIFSDLFFKHFFSESEGLSKVRVFIT